MKKILDTEDQEHDSRPRLMLWEPTEYTDDKRYLLRLWTRQSGHDMYLTYRNLLALRFALNEIDLEIKTKNS